MKRVAFGALLVTTVLLTASRAHAQAISANFTRISAGETVAAPYLNVAGTPTLGSYSGLTEIIVSGTGNAFGGTVSDAFYYLDGSPVGIYYGLNLGYPGLNFAGGGANNIQNWMLFIEGVGFVTPGTLPAYRADNTYRFVLDLPNQTPGPLSFGVSDGNYGDNGGQYNIQVYSLSAGTAAPEPGTLGLLALPLLGFIARRARK